MKIAVKLLITAVFAVSGWLNAAEKYLSHSSLNKNWYVFTKVKPPRNYGIKPLFMTNDKNEQIFPTVCQLQNRTIDIAKISQGFFEKECAILFNVFKSRERGTLRLGLSADWWMQVFINGTKVYDTTKAGNVSRVFSPDDHIVDIPLIKGKNTLAVRVLSGSNGWRLVCGNTNKEPKKKIIPLKEIVYKSDATWHRVKMSNLKVLPGSALDLTTISKVKTAENGRLQRLTANHLGKLSYSDNYAGNIRLNGSNIHGYWDVLNEKITKDELKERLTLFRRQGYNFLRFSVDPIRRNNTKFNTSDLDKLDFMLSEMGRQGIYWHLIVTASNIFFDGKEYLKNHKDRNSLKALMYLGDKQLRQNWEFGVKKLFAHINPYTGIAWKDDPTIFCVEYYNEQEGPLLWTNFTPEVQAKYNNAFREWLKNKYATVSALRKSWNSVNLKSFDSIKAPGSLRGNGTVHDEFVLFINDLALKNLQWYNKIIESTGYQGLTGQYSLPVWWGDLKTRYLASKTAICNRYFNHPTFQTWRGSKCRQNSSLETMAGYWRAANATRLYDRPFIITEHNHAFWNQYQYEGGLVFGAYSALQGFDAVAIHEGAAVAKIEKENSAWTVGYSPVARANEFLRACLYLRGDVKQSGHHIRIDIPNSVLDQYSTVSSQQDKIGLLCGLNIKFTDGKSFISNVSPVQPEMVISPVGGAKAVGENTGWSVDTSDTTDSAFDLHKFTVLMRQKGILPGNNKTNVLKDVFQSDTGEITMRSRDKLLKVITPKTEAVCLTAGGSEQLKYLEVLNTSTNSLVAICSIDQKPLAHSKRIVLIYSTATVNTGMKLSPDRVVLMDRGKLPILMQVGKLKIAIKSDQAKPPEVYALSLDGARKQKINCKISPNGKIIIDLDTSMLPDGPTPFFEITYNK